MDDYDTAKAGDFPKPIAVRHKCPACFKQYKKKEHLVEHMKVSYHSVHQPKCLVCRKHCKSLESVREHLTGPLSKGGCATVFLNQGCKICLNTFESSSVRDAHEDICRLSPACLDMKEFSFLEKSMSEFGTFNLTPTRSIEQRREVVAMDCEMVGGGSDGLFDLCARVCIIDENEKVLFHTFVRPQLPISDYRSDITGLTERNMTEATPLALVKQTVEKILYNGECLSMARLTGGRARLLVGHGLDCDLNCLKINYPDHLLRDTAKYPPLMKTNLVSHPLKYLAHTYLGYEIQAGIHDPYEDCVAALRIYKRMRAQSHEAEAQYMYNSSYNSDSCSTKDNLYTLSPSDLEEKIPDALLEMSCSKYRCWCLDERNSQLLNVENESNDIEISSFVEIGNGDRSASVPGVEDWPAW